MEQKIDWTNVVAATFRVEQSFNYAYPTPITNLQHKLVISPRADHGVQRRLTNEIGVSLDADRQNFLDEFGNDVTTFEASRVPDKISFTLRSDVVCDLRRAPHLVPTAEQEAFPSERPLIKADSALLAAADHLRARHTNPVALAHGISDFVYDLMTYTSGATTVATTAAQAFRLRKGVCQDYSHIAIAISRACGLPARYVSGHLIGEGASHAWVEFLVPTDDGRATRVLSLDPTNDCSTGLRHVVIAVGRDYADVAPTSGVYCGTGDSEITSYQSVRVIDLEYNAVELAA